jgi:predicted transcriptional regulator
MTGQQEINFNIHANSLAVYEDKVLPNITGRKLEVFNAIKSLGGSATLWEVSQHLNKPIHTLSGRITELKKMQLIFDTGKNKIHNDSPFSILNISE